MPRHGRCECNAIPIHHAKVIMHKSAFLEVGHTPTLLAAFLYFDLAFMDWVILGPLGVRTADDLQLTHAQKGVMPATPVLAGVLLRFAMG